MNKSFYKLEAYDDGKQPIVGRLFDSAGNEVDDPEAGKSYNAELDFCQLKSDKHLKDALHSIQGRLAVSEDLAPLFAGVAFAEVHFSNLQTRKKYQLLVPIEVVHLNRQLRKVKNKLGMEVTEWEVEAASLAKHSFCFNEIVLGWIVDDEFKEKCERKGGRSFEFKKLVTY